MTTATTLPPRQTARARSYPGPVWTSILLYRYLRGYLDYRRTGTTSYESSITLRRLFRQTNGRFNDAIGWAHRILHPPHRYPDARGILGELNDGDIARIAQTLRAEGLCLLGPAIPEEMCRRLRAFARATPCRVQPTPASGGASMLFDADRPAGVRYSVEAQALHEQPDLQRLGTDRSLLSIAQAYLGCRPVYIGAKMFWSTAASPEACSEVAQLYHFDMPQARFLKIFVYLTDVGEDQGPHAFVRGSHRRLPPSLRTDRRYEDREVAHEYPADRFVSITGPAGTMFAEDTRGLHKGTPLRTGHRLLLQLQYATSAYGEVIEPVEVNERFSPEFRDAVSRYPRSYAHRFHHSK